MNKTNRKYTMTVTNTGERYVDIEILDDSCTIGEVVGWLEEGGVEGFNPIHHYPAGAEEWAGPIKHDGRVVALYTISDFEESGDVKEVYENDTDEVGSTEAEVGE